MERLAWISVLPGILLFLYSLCLPPGAASAQTDNENATARPQAKRIYSLQFISLKPGCSLGPGKLKIADNGTFVFFIRNENLRQSSCEYTEAGNRFTAETAFSVKNSGSNGDIRYILVMNGWNLFGLSVAGYAHLKQFLGETLLQDILFVFYGKPENGPESQYVE